MCVPILVSIVASIPACHAGDPGSIPGRGAFSSSFVLSFFCPFVPLSFLSIIPLSSFVFRPRIPLLILHARTHARRASQSTNQPISLPTTYAERAVRHEMSGVRCQMSDVGCRIHSTTCLVHTLSPVDESRAFSTSMQRRRCILEAAQLARSGAVRTSDRDPMWVRLRPHLLSCAFWLCG